MRNERGVEGTGVTNVLDGLLGRVDDPELRAALELEVANLRDTKDFGLVFERHMPENVELLSHEVRRGAKVRLRGTSDDLRVVRRVRDGVAELFDSEGGSAEERVEDLVVVVELNDLIYPGLRVVGEVNRGGDKPPHLVINGENHHVLETLDYAYAGKVDAIYIDPPYNNRATDWKYNNDYVDVNDSYRHSKWLAFMERRLRLAKRLLNPERSVLIVTIDEKEYLRLGLLLEQVFPNARRIQMVSSVINPKGTGRQAEFSRTDEYVFFVMLGDAAPKSEPEGDGDETVKVEWGTLRRRDLSSVRHTRPQQFYPLYVDVKSKTIKKIGDPLGPDEDRSKVPAMKGCETVWPVRPDGTEMNWGLIGPALAERLAKGYVRVGRHEPDAPQKFVISYLKSGPISDIEEGRAFITKRNKAGDVEAHYLVERTKLPTTNWQRRSHNAELHGSVMLGEFLPGRSFPFPKSLYAVEDCLRFFVIDNPDAVIIDFFGGSGTTAHAVARLNRTDGGRRRSIIVTNNEVSAAEAAELEAAGHRPGDPEWEQLGIFEHITMPRVTAAFTGCTPDGAPVEGEYKFGDEFPYADGFEENALFCELTYLDRDRVSLGAAFAAVAPLLWMKAGGTGEMITETSDDFAMPGNSSYAVLFDATHWGRFVDRLRERPDIAHVFVVTDSNAHFQQVVAELPHTVEAWMLYEDYLRNFEFKLGGGA